MESLQGPDLDAEAHPGEAGFQMYLFWVLLKLSSGNQEGPTGEGSGPVREQHSLLPTLRLLPSLTFYLHPLYLPARAVQGLGKRKANIPTKVRILKQGLFLFWSASYIAFCLSG